MRVVYTNDFYYTIPVLILQFEYKQLKLSWKIDPFKHENGPSLAL